MQEETKRKHMHWILYVLSIALIALAALLIIESCDAEKIEVCDTRTGQCELESSCRPLLFDLLR